MIINYPDYVMICTGFALVLGLYCCSPASKEQADNAVSEVEAREIAFAGTMADRDFDAFLTFVSPEAVFFSGNEPRRGREAVSKTWAPYFEGEKAPFSWHPDVIEVLGSGHLALTSGPVRAASGEIIGRFNSIWRKDEDGQWRVVFDKGS
jgi:ketosteroid isomerase-like protein